MTTVYLLLLLAAAVAFLAALLQPARPWLSNPRLVSLGLLLWVLVPLIQTIRAA